MSKKVKLHSRDRLRAKKHRLQYPQELTEVNPEEYRDFNHPLIPNRVFISRKWLVQIFIRSDAVIRLSVNSTKRHNNRWVDGISWDELMEIKRQCGYGDRFAVEVYPEDNHVINVANLRHLWILPQRLDFAWEKSDDDT